jgi:hypothetical protein
MLPAFDGVSLMDPLTSVFLGKTLAG